MVGEIGSGGGRIAKRVCASVEKLVCFDICEEMLEAAKRNMGESGNVEFQLLKVRLEGGCRIEKWVGAKIGV